MALERQKTFKTTVNKSIESVVEDFLRTQPIDPAAIQIVIDNDMGEKLAILTYGERDAIKKLYEEQNRTYTDADTVTYCHVKDIFVPLNKDLDDEVNNFLTNDNIATLSISRYATRVNKGAFIFYIDLIEQKAKQAQKAEEVAKAREELAQKLAQTAIKDVDLDTNNTVEKYVELSDQNSDTSNVATTGLAQIENNEDENLKVQVAPQNDSAISTTSTLSESADRTIDNGAILQAEREEKKSKKHWKK